MIARRARALAIPLGAAVGVLVAISGLTGSFVIPEHVVCRFSGALATNAYQRIPAVLVNSPFGGRGDGVGHGWGVTVLNGTAGAVMMSYANVTPVLRHLPIGIPV